MDATPVRSLPTDASTGWSTASHRAHAHPRSRVHLGHRTYVMGIINVTPDSFSGDGILSQARCGRRRRSWPAVEQATQMAAEGADILDVGGESTRPGHAEVLHADEETRRIDRWSALSRRRCPTCPSASTRPRPTWPQPPSTPARTCINDIWGTAASDDHGSSRGRARSADRLDAQP